MKRARVKTVSKITACILASLTVAMTLTACGSGSSSSAASGVAVGLSSRAGPAKITFWNAFTGSDATELKALVQQFNDQNKGKYEVDMNIMSNDAYSQKLPVSLATSTGPDLMTMTPNEVITYAEKNKIWSIDDIFSETGLDKSDIEGTALDFCKVNGKLYGLPLEMMSNYLYWNKDLFKTAGLDPDKAPASLSELVSDAIKLTDASKNQYGFAMPVKGAPAFYAGFIRGNGGSVVEGGKCVFNTPANVATVKMLKEMADKKVSPTSASGVDTDNVMLSGKMGMYINGPWLIPGLKSHKINFGVAKIPAGTKGASYVLDGVIFGIAKSSTGASKTAAYQFLKYWNSTEVGKAWALKVGFPPYLKSVVNDSEVKADKNVSILASALQSNNAKTWLVGVTNGAKIDSDVLFPMIEKLQNGTSAEDAVKSASDAVDKLLTANS
jgi:multiple sugar transport system substrate-binding protein